jgi:solute carrier family 39 (zinc transporter), member 1/2/3
MSPHTDSFPLYLRQSDLTTDASGDDFDPSAVNLSTADPAQVICFLNAGGNDYDGRLGARISAIFVILVVSTSVTFFPVLASRIKQLRIPLYVYLFARYFGAGVIIATAFIHLLDPAYQEIGPNTCVGMTGNWAQYSWVPAIALTSVMLIFLVDFAAEWYVEEKYGFGHAHGNLEGSITDGAGHTGSESDNNENGAQHDRRHNHEHAPLTRPASHAAHSHQFLHSADQDASAPQQKTEHVSAESSSDVEADKRGLATERDFYSQIAAFLVLEFGVIFHSVIIGLNLGVVGEEFSTLYAVIVFHQSFEGLGIGARLSAIPFPKAYSWLPWTLCAAYGLTTPVAIAIGLGLRTTYDSGSFTANVVSGVFDATSAGILLYTGLVELLARDFLFNPERTRDKKRIIFMLVCLYLGTALMALLGKWA